jgi:hypothetical protein
MVSKRVQASSHDLSRLWIRDPNHRVYPESKVQPLPEARTSKREISKQKDLGMSEQNLRINPRPPLALSHCTGFSALGKLRRTCVISLFPVATTRPGVLFTQGGNTV